MKAWSVVDYGADCGYIVFAKTRGKAHASGYLAMGRAELECSDWQDIEVCRLPDLDGQRDAPCVLDWQKDSRMYYEAGWSPMDGASSCDYCGRYEYLPQFPESRVIATDASNICVACLARARVCLARAQGRAVRVGYVSPTHKAERGTNG